MINIGENKVLITVGTTSFDELVQAVDSETFLRMLQSVGIVPTDLLFQIGETYINYNLSATYRPIHGQYITLSSTIQQIYDNSSIIITHGGAGTLLACLCDQPNKKIIAVVNDTLKDNHQKDIVNKLTQLGYVLGFMSVKEMMENKEKVERWIKDGRSEEYRREKESVLNKLVFGE